MIGSANTDRVKDLARHWLDHVQTELVRRLDRRDWREQGGGLSTVVAEVLDIFAGQETGFKERRELLVIS